MTAGVRLYDLANAREILEDWLAEHEGEVTPELEQLLADLEGDSKEKIERVALFVQEQLATAKAIVAEGERLTARAATLEKAATGLKAYLKTQMERLGTTKVEGLLATVAIQRNSVPAIKTTLAANELYALEDARPFVKREEMIVYKVDNAAVLAAFKAQQPLPAAIAVEQGTHIRIR